MNDKNGFTLIELLIVVALFGMLAAILIPQMKSFNKRQVLASAAAELVSEIQGTQTMAASGVQGNTVAVRSYLFSFIRESTDEANYYRGYTLSAIDENGFEIAPALETQVFDCPVCIISTQASFNYSIPTGRVDNLLANEFTFNVCHPEQGQYQITLDVNGRVFQGDYIAGSCTCQRGCNN